MSSVNRKDTQVYKKTTNVKADNSAFRNCRKRLQQRFDLRSSDTKRLEKGNRSVLSVLSLDDPRKIIQNGADKISRTITNVRTTIGTISQKFRRSTKRRYRLEEGPMTPGCVTPQTHSRRILGRTPTKLYSPFSIDSPGKASLRGRNKENVRKQLGNDLNKFPKKSEMTPKRSSRLLR